MFLRDGMWGKNGNVGAYAKITVDIPQDEGCILNQTF